MPGSLYFARWKNSLVYKGDYCDPYPTTVFVLKISSAFHVICIYSSALQTRFFHRSKQYKLEDLKVLWRSPDHLKIVKIVQGQLQLIMEQILFYHIWGLQPFWSSDLNNLMNNPSNSPVILRKRCLDRFVAK